jgi:hypothetical protein
MHSLVRMLLHRGRLSICHHSYMVYSMAQSRSGVPSKPGRRLRPEQTVYDNFRFSVLPHRVWNQSSQGQSFPDIRGCIPLRPQYEIGRSFRSRHRHSPDSVEKVGS